MTNRMAPMFIVVFCFSLLLNAFLDYSNFKRNHTEIERSRFSVVLRDLQDTVEYALNLGVAISDFSQFQQMIESTQKRYPEITGINVIDTKGVSIFNTDKEMINKTVSKKWHTKAFEAKDSWYVSDKNTHTIGVPIVNGINMVNASLSISYSQKNLTDKLETVRNELAKVTLALMLIFSVMIFLGLKWINKGFERTFLDMEKIISQEIAIEPSCATVADSSEMKGFIDESRTAYSRLVDIDNELKNIERDSK